MVIDRKKIALLALATFVTAPLIVLDTGSTYLVAITLQPRSENLAQLPCKEALIQANGKGWSSFSFQAS